MPSEILEDDCPPEEEVAAFLRGGLDAEHRRSLEAHVARCSPCRRLLSALAEAGLGDSTSVASSLSPTMPLGASDLDAEVRLGMRFGRYLVLDLLGAGGMGVVYAAHDPDLNRRVALKVLRKDRSTAADQRPIRDTLLREAQAMAQLAHPNVVTVYDIGTVDDRVFIAMELVEGQTLSRWLAAAPRTRREILDAFVAAGHGLAAAHAAGLIHRDFKPDNVLIGRDGRVRVTDFGLARAAAPEVVEGAPRGSLEPGGAASSHTGLAGTLAYMAPEQLSRRASDARADQFSFAVALYEALTGQRPFAEPRLPGAATPARPRGDLPAALHEALQRALRISPGQRYPSMAALLAALAPRPRRDRRSAAAAVIALACALAAAGGYAIYRGRAAEERAQQARRGADERALLAGRLRGRAVEVRAGLRNAHMLAQHDIRPAREEVRGVMREVEAQRATPAGEGDSALIDFVIGEAHLALAEYPGALEALEAAWNAGERSPQIEASLGYVLGILYSKRLEELEDTVPVDRRAAAQRALEERYREPAKDHLKAALAARAGSVEYLEALVAFHEQRFDDASRLADQAYVRSRTFYEAGMLEAQALQSAAGERMISGRRREGLDTFAAARAVSADVANNARSDDDAWLAHGELLYSQLVWFRGDPLYDTLREEAITTLHTVSVINPDRWEPWLYEAHLYEGEANGEIIAFRDPSVQVAKVLALATQARARGAPGYEADVLVCLAHWAQAIHDGNHGRDPHRELQQAGDACDRAVAAKPSVSNLTSLAAVHGALASYNANHGVDPIPAVELGERQLRAAIAISDDAVFPYSIGRLWIAVANYQDGHGRDASAAIEHTLSELERSTRADATRSDAWATRAEALVLRARRQRAVHVDAAATLTEARTAIDRALQITPSLPAPLRHRMALAELEAEALVERNADPGAAVARMRADGQLLLQRVPDDVVAHRLLCEGELIAARWALSRGKAVLPLLADAALQAAQARDADPMDARAWLASAAVERLRADAARARGAAPDAAVASGLELADRALALDPGLVAARAMRDQLQRAP